MKIIQEKLSVSKQRMKVFNKHCSFFPTRSLVLNMFSCYCFCVQEICSLLSVANEEMVMEKVTDIKKSMDHHSALEQVRGVGLEQVRGWG